MSCAPPPLLCIPANRSLAREATAPVVGSDSDSNTEQRSFQYDMVPKKMIEASATVWYDIYCDKTFNRQHIAGQPLGLETGAAVFIGKDVPQENNLKKLVGKVQC